MKLFLLSTLCTVFLYAQGNSFPKIYESLGNEIYANAAQIKKLKKLKEYDGYKAKIDTYIADVKVTKELGYKLESQKNPEQKLEYLNALRQHKTTNDYFRRSAQSVLKSAIDNKDNALLKSIVKSGLLNTPKDKRRIANYYKHNKSALKSKKVSKKVSKKSHSTKKVSTWRSKREQKRHEEKIKRLRKNDKLNEEAVEKKLSDELKMKKEAIRKEQERELFR